MRIEHSALFPLLLSLVLWCVPPAVAKDVPPVGVHCQALCEETDSGQNLVLALTLDIRKGYHVYAHDEVHGRPLRADVALTPGLAAEIWYPRWSVQSDWTATEVHVLTGTVHLFVRLRRVEETSAPSSLDVAVSGLACSESRCVPFSIPVTVDIPAGNLPQIRSHGLLAEALSMAYRDTTDRQVVPKAIDDSAVPIRSDWSFTPRYAWNGLEPGSLLKSLIFGLAAGIILNFMPCVLPVLALKIAALADLAKTDRRRFIRNNLAFAAGIIAWFGIFAVIFATFDALWGEVFRMPAVIAVLTLIVGVLALSLFGIVRIPVLGFRIGLDSGTSGDAFVSGFLVTILATPCSGPLLGGVLAWAVMRRPIEQGMVFFAVGLGMALPFILMAVTPSTARLIPKPGRWCDIIAKGAGVLLLVTAVYLVSLLPWFSSSPQRFDADAFRAQLGRENMLVQFTADWCPTCKILERTVLSDGALAAYRAKYGLKVIRVDLTVPSAAAEGLLRALGSVSIPMTALFRRDGKAFEPIVLRDIYSGRQLENAMRDAFGY